jgi:hypothetical protein
MVYTVDNRPKFDFFTCSPAVGSRGVACPGATSWRQKKSTPRPRLLSPLPGLEPHGLCLSPRLSPWATLCRPPRRALRVAMLNLAPMRGGQAEVDVARASWPLDAGAALVAARGQPPGLPLRGPGRGTSVPHPSPAAAFAPARKGPCKAAGTGTLCGLTGGEVPICWGGPGGPRQDL